MECVLAVERTKLLHLDPLAVVEFVLRRDVVPALAVLTFQGHLDSFLIFRHLALPRFLLTSLIYAGNQAPRQRGSGGGIRTRDNTIMSRVL